MRTETLLKLGQILGALFLAGGISACILKADPQSMSWSFIVGAVLYGGCRLAMWLRSK